jgi:hypothetical protein
MTPASSNVASRVNNGGSVYGVKHKFKGEELPACVDYDNLPPTISKRINVNRLKNEGVIEYSNLSAFSEECKEYGLEVINHKIEDTGKLKRKKVMRGVATGGAVLFDLLGAVSLFSSGGKLLSNSFSGTENEEEYKGLNRSYLFSGIGGALTGLSQDSLTWFAGALGMSAVSATLDFKKFFGLGLFSIFDGTQSLGMGDARRREFESVSDVHKPIIGNIPFLKFLAPLEQGVISSIKNWNNTSLLFKEEPFTAFQTVGGHLISGGSILTAMSVAQNFISERVQSMAYFPYAILSGINQVSLFRDGSSVLQRAREFGSRKKYEEPLMNAEGWLKRIAAPILGLNNVMLAVKGLGVEMGGAVYNLAMGFRAVGAGFAFLGFKFQSLQNFIRPDKLGSKHEEHIEYKLDMDKASKTLFPYIKGMMADRPESFQSFPYEEFISEYGNNDLRKIYAALDETKINQYIATVTQTGISTPFNEDRSDRYNQNRKEHCRAVSALMLPLLHQLNQNTKNPRIQKALEEMKYALPLTGEFHDYGHLAFSHFSEQVKSGFKNNEGSMRILKEKGSEIKQVLVNQFGEEKAESEILKIQDILGKQNFGYHLLKILGDYVEYNRLGDHTFTGGFPKWDLEDVMSFINEIRLFEDENGVIKTGFSPKGALTALFIYSDITLHHGVTNKHPLVEGPLKLVQYILQKSGLSLQDLKTKSEPELFDRATALYDKLPGTSFSQETWRYSCGEHKDGYSDAVPDRVLDVVMDDGSHMSLGEYLKKDPDSLANNSSALYSAAMTRIKGLQSAKKFVERYTLVSGVDDFSKKTKVRDSRIEPSSIHEQAVVNSGEVPALVAT